MRIFLAGIMQGSLPDDRMHDQRYRPRLIELLEQYLPGCTVYDPLADHRDSLSYDASTAERVFLDHLRMCREMDAVVAFLPEASMGTAIEMWEARRAERTVIGVTPLDHNWAVRFCCDAIYPDVPALERALHSGELRKCLVI